MRRTHTTYETGSFYTANAVNLLNLPTETWVSSDISGNTKVSRSQFEYDNYNFDSTHAALTDRSNISGHNSNYGVGYITRGNVTKTTSYADAQYQTGAISVYAQYDIAGNVVKNIDARGNATTIDYTDKFGAPDGEARANSAPGSLNGLSTYAFASSMTDPGGRTVYMQRDFNTNGVVNTEDFNGNVSMTLYNDDLDRPTQTISANNHSSYKNQSTATYDDTSHKVTITSDSKTYGDNLIKSEAYCDGFGRTIESRIYESASNYTATLVQYDPLGGAYKTSNPFRPYLNETAQWTTTTFDSLGRVIEVKTPDNSKVTRMYDGSKVQVNDQYDRARAGITDALGRMTKVIEYNAGIPVESLYTYDVMGRLRKTSQTEGQVAQNRYFMYNDLGRLIRARQVEQGTNSNLNLTDPVTGNSSWSVAYSYDNNGNTNATTDARGITVYGNYV